MPKYPHITVQLTGENGNAFTLLGHTMRAMRKAGINKVAIADFVAEAVSDDYNHLIQTIQKTVNVE